MENYKCGKKYQTSKLSHTEGGWDIAVKMTYNKKAIVYTNIKNPTAYTNSVLEGKEGYLVEYIKKIGKSQ